MFHSIYTDLGHKRKEKTAASPALKKAQSPPNQQHNNHQKQQPLQVPNFHPSAPVGNIDESLQSEDLSEYNNEIDKV